VSNRARYGKRPVERYCAQVAAGLFTLLGLAPRAWADKVAVLPFGTSTGGTTSAQLDEARASTRTAILQLRHTLPSDSEMVTAQMAVQDGIADTSAEYRAAGRASSAQWTVAGHLDSHGVSYRLELEACQVETGRVESLAREVDLSQAPAQIGEMLVLLLRPEGIGNTDPPWTRAAPKPAIPPPAPPQQAAPPPPPPQPAVPEDPSLAYAAGHPVGVGLGIGALAAVKRAENARGSATAGVLTASFGYAIEHVRGLELRAELTAGLLGPQSFTGDAGARFMLPLVRRARIFVGPEIGLGAFFALGGDRAARLLVRGALPIAWAPDERWQIELVPEVDYAGGGTSALFLAGASARAVYRF
jgi:hypothetical protein